MASVLDWAYWHLARDTSRRVIGGDDPVIEYISPGQLPPGEPARQVSMSILRGSAFEPWDGDPLAGWHRVTLGVDARAESEAKVDPAADESPDEWCHNVLTKIRDNLLSFSADGVPSPMTAFPWCRLAARSRLAGTGAMNPAGNFIIWSCPWYIRKSNAWTLQLTRNQIPVPQRCSHDGCRRAAYEIRIRDRIADREVFAGRLGAASGGSIGAV